MLFIAISQTITVFFFSFLLCGNLFFWQTLKRGLFLAFCYTFVCLLYVSLYYTEPYSNNYGYDESNIPKSVQDAHSEEVRRDADHKEPKKGEEGTRQEETQEEEELLRDDEMVTAAATPLKEVPANTILKPNSTGMPWINYKTVLTNQVSTVVYIQYAVFW